MTETEYGEFLEAVDENNREFVSDLHTFLLENGCDSERKTAKSGYTVSYILNDTGKTLANYVFRKTGIKMRIYPKNLNRYEELLNTFPDKMKKDIKKSSVCKRMVNPDACNPRCSMGYRFDLEDEIYEKCRYMAFFFGLSEENNPFIKALLKEEFN
jgi:hypothetical protein